MDKKKLILLIGALAIAAVAAFTARSLFMGSGTPVAEAQAPKEQPPMVLVAKRALPVGTIITPDALTLQPWPEELVKDAYYVQQPGKTVNINDMRGRVVRFAVTAGEPVTRGALVAPGDRGFLAAALGPGMRAITLPVNGPTGVGGFVFPGDRVDLVLTQNVDGEGQPLKVSETIIRNLRVLATNQQVEATKNEEGKTVPQDQIQLVTLEVTPRIAEKITVAQSIGTISLSLRSLADNQNELDQAIASGEIKLPEGLSPAEEKKVLAAAARRPLEGKPSYSTGGDVSRFQRSTVPAQKDSGGGRAAAPAPAPAAPAPTVIRTTQMSGDGSKSVATVPSKPKAVVRISGGRDAVVEFDKD